MYASPEQRDADIETSTQQSPADLRHDVTATAAVLDQAFAGLTEAAWDARVRVRQGQPVSARLLPCLRVREVWLRAVDLDAGADLAAAPAALLDELVAHITTWLSGEPACPQVELRVADRDATWRLGASSGTDERPAVAAVEGTAAELVLWLAGRTDGSAVRAAGPPPPLPRWL